MVNFLVIRQNFFQQVERMKLMKKITNLHMEKSKHHIKIGILGLRNLQSSGFLPVKRVKVKINTSSLKSIRKMREGAAFTDLVAVAKSKGSNPTIGSVLNMTVELPTDIANMPSLSCQVID